MFTSQQILERINTLLRSETRQALLSHGLQPVQYEALQYLAVCNHYSDTAMAVTEYLGQTKGTVSQTLKVLEKKALIRKQADKKDKRVAHLKVTAKGKKLLTSLSPSNLLQSGLQQLPHNQQSQLQTSLQQLLSGLQQANQGLRFGVCHSCQYHQRREQQRWCQLTDEAIAEPSADLICREFQLPRHI